MDQYNYYILHLTQLIPGHDPHIGKLSLKILKNLAFPPPPSLTILPYILTSIVSYDVTTSMN